MIINRLNRRCVEVLFLLMTAIIGNAQTDTIHYDMQTILNMAKKQSLYAYEVESTRKNAISNYKLFKAELLPQVNASINIPNYNQTFREIVQPDGGIQFQSIEQNNSSVNLGITQRIAKTGGQLFLQSDLQRFDNFANNSQLYNGIPFRIGFYQPIGAFNLYKWKKKIEPLKLKESTRQYNMELEAINGRALFYFFELLLSDVNLQIAGYNKTINENLLKIADERLELGKISKSDRLQLQFELNSAKKDYLKTKYLLESVTDDLNAFLGERANDEAILLLIPDDLPKIVVDYEVALQKALKNRPALLRYERELLESQMNIDKAKKENGLNASLFASFGFARGATNIEDIYKDPQREKQLSLQINIPLVDWGKRKEFMAIAERDASFLHQKIKYEQLDFENRIKQVVELFHQLEEEVELQKEGKSVASQRFEISRQRYVLGNISITELAIAQKEKDQSQRDYIFSLRDYWLTFYELRRLTGYDFVKHTQLY